MSYRRGDIVLVDVAFGSRPGSKIRPMVVIQNDRNNARMNKTILATITTNTSRVGEPTQVFIDVSTPDGRRSGLIANSSISCENLVTVEQVTIRRKIGELSPALTAQLSLALKDSLQLT